MEFEFEDMERTQSKLSVEIHGPSGSGKTTSAIKIAMGIRDQLYPGSSLKDIGLYIDSERRSSTKAVGRSVGGETLESLQLYDFEPPYDVYKLAQLINYATSKGKKIIVLDSATAFWSGQEGILERAAELEVSLADAKKMYGAWSEKEIIQKKNILKQIMTNADAHLIVCCRAKTEYAMEANSRGKLAPKAIGLKEDMQSDVRYEFDVVLSLDRESHNSVVVKDRIGYEEIKLTSANPEAPITVEDGKILAKIVSEGISMEEMLRRKTETLISFILNEKAHKSTKVKMFEEAKKVELTEAYLRSKSYETLVKLVNILK